MVSQFVGCKMESSLSHLVLCMHRHLILCFSQLLASHHYSDSPWFQISGGLCHGNFIGRCVYHGPLFTYTSLVIVDLLACSYYKQICII